ncbi:MAG: methylated-DNA--[protein]-cysteine S-methyltransferase [Chloroflexota bacterium]|nr:methylated-DNA--[protein]-cysteine S-methyltransferase [Chloroflexota bacterium]
MKTISFGTITTSHLGIIGVAMSEQGLVNTDLRLASTEEFAQAIALRQNAELVPGGERVADALRQIEEYLAGDREEFEIPIDWSGMTEFKMAVLRATLGIPYGETLSYGEVAAQIGRPRAARAVGQAEAKNPIPLVIPCHRVIGANGEMRGYGGPEGVNLKAWILAFEAGETFPEG